ncbi:MAG TPA: hypothetical protein V6C96_00165, partial [Vampirovibrionales bacterium]
MLKEISSESDKDISAKYKEFNGYEKIERLREKIKQWNKEYYEDNKPSVSDEVYDALYKELKDLEIRNDWIKKEPYKLQNSPTQTIGSSLTEKSGFAKVAHKTPMLSLENAFDENDLRAWIERHKKNLLEENNDSCAELEYVAE